MSYNNIFFDKTITSSELKAKVASILPTEFPTLVLSATHEVESGFSCLLRLPLDNKNDILEWKKRFEEMSLTTYRISGAFEENTQKIVFKKRYHCHHNTRPKSNVRKPHIKHTACTAKLTITVKQRSMKRSKDQYLKKYPCEITIYYVHNHLIGEDKANVSCKMDSTNYSNTDDNTCHEDGLHVSEDADSERNLEVAVSLSDNLKDLFTILEEKMLVDPQTFAAPVSAFVRSFTNIRTDSDLVSALHSFGKYSGARKRHVKKEKNLQDSKLIGVQPADVARRKICVGGGKAQLTGSPHKGLINDHDYKRKGSTLELPYSNKEAPDQLDGYEEAFIVEIVL